MRNGLYIFLLTLILSSGCNKFNLTESQPKRVNSYFTLTPAEFGSISTRAGVAVDENSVINLWVLQFDGTTDGSKLVRSEYMATVGSLADLQIVLNQGANHRVLFIANTFDSELFNEVNAPLNTYTLLQFKEKAFSLADENGMLTGETTKYLRMYGSYIGVVPNKNSSITLYRICSKVNINYISEDVSAIQDGVRFRITSLQLKNVPATSSYISNPTNSVFFSPPSMIDYQVTTGSLAGTAGESYSIDDYVGYVTYYMPENIAGVNSSVGSQSFKSLYAPAKATWLEIKGEGISSDGRINEYATFKFYLGNNLITDYNVNTNTIYSFTVRFKGLNIKDMRLEIIRISDIEVIVEEEWI